LLKKRRKIHLQPTSYSIPILTKGIIVLDQQTTCFGHNKEQVVNSVLEMVFRLRNMEVVDSVFMCDVIG